MASFYLMWLYGQAHLLIKSVDESSEYGSGCAMGGPYLQMHNPLRLQELQVLCAIKLHVSSHRIHNIRI